jgi:hypothetical protein
MLIYSVMSFLGARLCLRLRGSFVLSNAASVSSPCIFACFDCIRSLTVGFNANRCQDPPQSRLGHRNRTNSVEIAILAMTAERVPQRGHVTMTSSDPAAMSFGRTGGGFGVMFMSLVYHGCVHCGLPVEMERARTFSLMRISSHRPLAKDLPGKGGSLSSHPSSLAQ